MAVRQRRGSGRRGGLKRSDVQVHEGGRGGAQPRWNLEQVARDSQTTTLKSPKTLTNDPRQPYPPKTPINGPKQPYPPPQILINGPRQQYAHPKTLNNVPRQPYPSPQTLIHSPSNRIPTQKHSTTFPDSRIPPHKGSGKTHSRLRSVRVSGISSAVVVPRQPIQVHPNSPKTWLSETMRSGVECCWNRQYILRAMKKMP
eukprot:197804-Chlamydomonas_euryale.AAC.1